MTETPLDVPAIPLSAELSFDEIDALKDAIQSIPGTAPMPDFVVEVLTNALQPAIQNLLDTRCGEVWEYAKSWNLAWDNPFTFDPNRPIMDPTRPEDEYYDAMDAYLNPTPEPNETPITCSHCGHVIDNSDPQMPDPA
jgi:hypothetical protein